MITIYLVKGSKIIIHLQQFVPISCWIMFVYILFVGVLVVFVWVQSRDTYVVWRELGREFSNCATRGVRVHICTHMPHSLSVYGMARYYGNKPSVVQCVYMLHRNMTSNLINVFFFNNLFLDIVLVELPVGDIFLDYFIL